jgi:hypothetical protein
MNCFNHTDEPAVASCVDCGKGLCKECASLYEFPICNECNAKRSKKEKNQLVIKYIPSIILFAGGFVFGLKTGNIGSAVVTGYIFAGFLWGWSVITFIQPKMFLFLSFFGWALYFLVKGIIAMFVGIVALPIGIGSIIISQIHVGSKSKNIERNMGN